MPIWDGATVVLERSGDGHTAQVLASDDTVLASCDDAGTVTGADGSQLMTAVFSWPRGVRSRPTEAVVEVAGAGTLAVKGYKVTPFSKKLTLGLLDPSGTEVGELSATDRKGRELAVTAGGSPVADLKLADRDRGIAKSVERWSLQVIGRPEAPADLLAAAAILRYGKVLAEVSVQGRD